TPSSLVLVVNGVKLNSEPTIQVNPGPLNGAASSLNFATQTIASGTTDILTITLLDADGNGINGFKSSAFAFSYLGGTSSGTIGPVTATGAPGTYTAVFTGIAAGTPKGLSLKVAGIPIASHPTVQVTPGAASDVKSIIGLASSSIVSGKSELISLVVKDAAGNPIDGLTSGDFDINLSGGQSGGIFGTVSETLVPGHYTVEFTGTSAGTASILTVAIDNVLHDAEPKLTVKAGSVSGTTSSASFATSTIVSGETEILTFTIEDAAGNPISGLPGSAFVLNLAGGKSTGKIGPIIPSTTPGVYHAIFTGDLAGTASTLEIKVAGVLLGSNPTVQVTPGPVNAAKSIASVTTPTVKTGNTDTLTIILMDTNGNAIGGLDASDFVIGPFGGTSNVSFATLTETQTPGTYTVVFTGKFAGTTTQLTITVDGVLLLANPKVTVTA
ncbi:MAG TPA: invasin domain 3-containing protein, partial [Gemmata sp.]|nr:invasin domain 3-containing protein [Gemmata sp.]